MGAGLSAVCATAGGAWATVELVSARLIDVKLGKRALIAYSFQSSDGKTWLLFGKRFADFFQAKRVYEALVALYDATRVPSSHWGVPRPLGWLPERRLVLYVPVWGHFLDDAIVRTGGGCLARAAECLAELHATRLRLDRHLDLTKESANVAAWAGVVASIQPELATVAERLARRLARLARSIDLESGVIHKDLHYKHMVVGSKLTLLDIDEIRLGDASFDVAHFCAYLHLLGLRSGVSSDVLEQCFLDAYAGHKGWTLDEPFHFFFAYACLKIAWQLCLVLGVRPRPTGVEQQLQARAVLGLAEARLECLASGRV